MRLGARKEGGAVNCRSDGRNDSNSERQIRRARRRCASSAPQPPCELKGLKLIDRPRSRSLSPERENFSGGAPAGFEKRGIHFYGEFVSHKRLLDDAGFV